MNMDRLFKASLLSFAVVGATTASAADWLQFGYDQAHSGFNRIEGGYAVANQPEQPVAFALHAMGNNNGLGSDSTPIYLSNVTTASGTKNLLYIVTKNGTLIALSAADGSVVWSKRPTPASGSNLTTGAPAVDPNRQFVYAYGLDGNVHKYAVGTGAETIGGGWPQRSTLKPNVEKGAAGLAIASPPGGTNYLYSVTDGYIGDGGDYQGHITSIDLSTGAQNVYNSECSDLTVHFSTTGTDCSSAQNGIWGRSGAVYDAGTNRIFISTGNGPYNANNSSGHNWGDSVLALNPDGTGSGTNGNPVDSYTPTTFQQLQNTDADLGSVSLAILPAPPGTAAAFVHLGVQPGKDGCVRLISTSDMSGMGGPRNTGGELQAIALPGGGNNCASGNDGNEIKPQPAVWVNPADSSTWIFVSNDAGITGYQVVLDGAGRPSLTQRWNHGGGVTSPALANDLLYYVTTGGTVHAADPTSGTTIWSDDSVGGLHWQTPIVVDGHLYVADNNSTLWSYALDGVFRGGFQ